MCRHHGVWCNSRCEPSPTCTQVAFALCLAAWRIDEERRLVLIARGASCRQGRGRGGGGGAGAGGGGGGGRGAGPRQTPARAPRPGRAGGPPASAGMPWAGEDRQGAGGGSERQQEATTAELQHDV